MNPTKAVAFNYNSLPTEELRREAREVAVAVRNLEDRRISDGLKIGELLLSMRKKMTFPQFETYCEAELRLSRGTARDYIKVYEKFAPVAKANPEPMKNIRMVAARELARGAVPEAARREAFALASSGQVVSEREALQLIGKHEPKSQVLVPPTARRRVDAGNYLPTPSRVEMLKARNAVQRLLKSCPAGDRAKTARELRSFIDELLRELAAADAADAPTAPIGAADVDEALLAVGAVG